MAQYWPLRLGTNMAADSAATQDIGKIPEIKYCAARVEPTLVRPSPSRRERLNEGAAAMKVCIYGAGAIGAHIGAGALARQS